MNKRNWIIVLGIMAVLVGGGLIAGWMGWRAVHYSERISGSAAIPKPRGLPGPVEKGQADWPCWRGPQGDGHSLVTGIRTDWSQGLERLWQAPWHTAQPLNATTPLVAGDIVFITSWHLRGCEALRVGDTRADVLWRSTVIASHHSDPVLCDGFLYGYSGQSDQNAGTFKCVDLTSGQEKWAAGDLGWGTAVWVDGHLLCMDIKGNLFLVKPSPSALRKVTELRGALGPVTHPARTIPVVANGRIYLRYMQRLVCYRLVP